MEEARGRGVAAGSAFCALSHGRVARAYFRATATTDFDHSHNSQVKYDSSLQAKHILDVLNYTHHIFQAFIT